MICYVLQGTNISPQNGILKMIFLFPRWYVNSLEGIHFYFTYWWIPKKVGCKKGNTYKSRRRIFELHLPRWSICTVSLTAICKIPRLLDGCGIWGRWSSRFAATKVTWFIWFGPQGTQVNWVYIGVLLFCQLRPTAPHFVNRDLPKNWPNKFTMISMFVKSVQSFAKRFIHERSEAYIYSPFVRVSLIWILFWYSLCPWHFLNTFLPLFLHRRHLYLLWIGHVYRLRCRWPQRSAGPGENQITEWARGVSHWASWKKSMNIYQSSTSWCFQICEF